MLKKLCWVFFLGLTATTSFAQDDEPPVKKVNHYFGLQANQLIRQIFNFSNTNNAVSNPYFFTYQINNTNTGSGLNVGLGYNYSQIDDGDQFVDRTTTANQLFFRAGFDKKSSLTKRWVLGWGIDMILENQKNSTETEEKTQTKNTFESVSKVTTWGLGPRLSLAYQINDRILVGTEANYYFKSSKESRDETSTFVSVEFDPVTGQQREIRRTTKNSADEKFKNFQFNAPAVIFLILKF